MAHNTAVAATGHPARVVLPAIGWPYNFTRTIPPASLPDVLFWLAAVCCTLSQAAIVRSALRAHAQRPDGSASPPRVTEVAWTIVPALVLVVVLVFTWRALHPAAGV
ncbi:MAG: hypothetical protein JJD97_13455 [Gemmatimonadaceae bacterium]|nr:hypothetical protein [Gemmatimonadaceae bacterium]